MIGAVVKTALVLLVLVLVASWLIPRYVFDSEQLPPDECIAQLDSNDSPSTGLFVEPDDAYDPVIDEIDGAHCEINLSMYLLTDQVVLDALGKADQRGVRVRVQLDVEPYGGGGWANSDTADWLGEHEIEWQWTPSSFTYSHAKYMVIDRRVAIVMNQNLTYSAFNQNREFGLVTTEPIRVNEALQVFESDWNNTPLSGPLDEIVTSPENSMKTLTSLITSSNETVDFYAEVIRDDGFVATLIDAEQRGVQVRLIVNESDDPEDAAVYIRLAEAGVEIRFSGRLYIHAKAMIFDNRIVFIGSQNPTTNSFKYNREVGLIEDDPLVLVRILDVFARDWAISVPASPEWASPVDISY